MDDKKTKIEFRGMGLAGLLFVVFLVLKLTGAVDWSWLWITSPLWIPFVAAVAVFIVGAFTIMTITILYRLLKDDQ